MPKHIVRLRAGLVILLGISLLYSSAFAMEVISKEDDGRGHRGYSRRDSREERHYYRKGSWYKHDSRGREVVVTALFIGALVQSLPPRHTTVVIQGAPYYHDDRYYYRQHSNGGYVVVSPPEIVQTPPQHNYDNRGERGGDSHNEGYRGENH